MSLFFISDLHITGPKDPHYGALLRVLNERAQTGDVVVLAGDIFDLFVGDKSVFTERYQEFLNTLESTAKKGVTLHYIEGNHDFLLGGVLRKIQGIRLHSAEVEILHGDRRFFTAHGDLVDQADYPYLLLRGFFRSPVMKLLVRAVPGRWLDEFGRFSSSQSRKRHRRSQPDPQKSLQRMERLRRVYRSFAAEKLALGFDFVVLGHCHDLDEMSFKIDGRLGQYVNIGFPKNHGSFLSWTPGDEKIHREKWPL